MKNAIPDYTTLVMSGGGIKGLGLLGALQFLADKHKLHHVHKYIGTSVGAIIGYLLSIGYSPIEIMVVINQKQIIEKMMKGLNMMDLIHHGGALNYFVLHEFLEDLTISKVGHVLTLRELYDEFGKILVCCTYNYNTKECEYLDYLKNPTLPCLTALRMSSTLPFLFHPFLYEGNLYVDGAVLDNFPVSQLDEDDVAVAIRLGQYNKVSTGSSFQEKQNARMKRPKRQASSSSTFDLMSYILEIVYIPIENANRMASILSKHKPIDTIHVMLDVAVFQWNISLVDKFNNFSVGYDTIKRYYQKPFIIPWQPVYDNNPEIK